MLPLIALVGRPNVGKSTLFNRLTGTRDALVASFPGLTRDRQYGMGKVGDVAYAVVDTGGLSDEQDGIDAPMQEQVRQAIGEADMVLFLVDSQDGRVAGDDAIAEMLRVSDTPCQLVANKIDGQNRDFVSAEFAALGMGEVASISATKGTGVRKLMEDHVAPVLPPGEHQPMSHAGVRIAVVGRPNVGKSTLVNRLLGEERVVVFDEAGTTRDSIYIPFEREGRHYTLIDTAGVRKRGRVPQGVEKFSVVKTLQAIEDTNVVLLLIDASDGLVEQDLHLLGHVLDAGRALVIVVNKWDALDAERRAWVKRELDRRIGFADFARTHFISALRGTGLKRLYASIHEAFDAAMKRVQTSKLNSILERAVQEHQPPLVRGRRIKLRYAHLGGSNPPRVVIHGNQTQAVPEAYKRYLVRRFTDALKLKGTPLTLEFKTADNPFKGRRNVLTERQVKRRQRMIRRRKKNAR